MSNPRVVRAVRVVSGGSNYELHLLYFTLLSDLVLCPWYLMRMRRREVDAVPLMEIACQNGSRSRVPCVILTESIVQSHTLGISEQTPFGKRPRQSTEHKVCAIRSGDSVVWSIITPRIDFFSPFPGALLTHRRRRCRTNTSFMNPPTFIQRIPTCAAVDVQFIQLCLIHVTTSQFAALLSTSPDLLVLHPSGSRYLTVGRFSEALELQHVYMYLDTDRRGRCADEPSYVH